MENRGTSWASLEVEAWGPTRETLHMWLQIVGKLRMVGSPFVNHWWHVTFSLSARGLTTGAIPVDGGVLDIEFDLLDHRLVLRTSDGGREELALTAMTVAEFYRRTFDALGRLGIALEIVPTPNEVVPAIPFAIDEEHCTYDSGQVHAFWQQLIRADGVLRRLRAEFRGKASPVHFFWGALDLATTRFSGRPAPVHPGGVPNCPDRVMVEGYSDEISSSGFWPGGGREGAFYSYAYPEPAGYAETQVPKGAYYDPALGEFLLPYEVVRQAGDPEALALEFLRVTSAAAARLGEWPAIG
ncbi:hypothetical protein LLS1_29210 [Leifsonia sp. LS1]|uniref:DUF5996 family protein n=1 Tax=Leifsonia sp. LS1 TaxID=2828483 RepID=UPI001CFDDDE2|nr:DUF5996 family protein [Leifsonia sp. LS1]GIT81252.1 hypothetical protein LLS1_29210 [Leifsonia sp. LS1]